MSGTYDDNVEQAKTLLAPLRVHGQTAGPMYGAVKAQAAQVYATLALADRVDALLGHLETRETTTK